MTAIKYQTADVDGFKIFYREAGTAAAPKLLLLHGFPSAGHMFRDLKSPVWTARSTQGDMTFGAAVGCGHVSSLSARS
jgi:pimeloyl-ACP methyl ester carboxylesterase